MLRSILILALLISGEAVAKVHRYVVFFTDKSGSTYSIDQPLQFLSQRSLDRRQKNSSLVTLEDLPVNQSYVDGLVGNGANVFFTTRWFNAAIVEMDETLVPTIDALSYVDHTEKVGSDQKLNGRSNYPRRYSPKQRITAGESDFQLNYIGADEMHSDGFKGSGILIAVTDGGFRGTDVVAEFAHLYNQGKIKYTFDFTTNDAFIYDYTDHGTQVLSTLGALSAGFSGVAPEADYMLLVTEDIATEYHIEEYNWLLAAEFADSAGVDIINASIGYNTFDEGVSYTYSDLDGNTTVITRAAEMAASKGMLVVTGAGNEGNKTWHYLLAPGDAPSVLTVGSVTSNGNVSSFSGRGPTADGRTKPDIATFGSSVAVISENGTITTGSGTSFSAPQIAGLAAGLMEAFPEMTVSELIEMLKLSGNNAQSPNNEIGFGIPNYLIFTAINGNELQPNYFKVYPNPVPGASIKLVSENLLESQSVEIKFINTRGQTLKRFQRKLNVVENSVELSLDNLPVGTYIMQVSTDELVESFRIIKVQ